MNDPSSKLPTVLNVDDFEPGRYARTRLLQNAGYTVEEASNGTDALIAAARYRPALVVLDVNLPDISGLEVCRSIKSDPGLSSTAVLQISASAVATTDQVRGLDTGADVYLTEPVEPAVFLSTVRALLRISATEQQLRMANEELKRSNEDLARFAYIASHDLQEPLRTITTYAQLLVRRYEHEKGSDAESFVRFIVEGTTRMSSLIRDLLLYSQVGARREFSTVSLDDVLKATLRSLAVSITDSSAEIESEPLPTVFADAEQLGHLFQNLISNSIKYRSAAPPRIHVSARRQSHDTWELSIRDNGMGFPSRYAEQIFEAFRRLDRSTNSGSGIGLAIAKRVVENHGGKIWAESTPGEGATFHFTLLSKAPA